jgi:hypothetical protein
MTSERRRRTTTLSRAVGVTLLLMHQSWPAAQVGALKIVVLEGEGAINIIQQKTAVAPVIEVRDRNNQPVAGAIVRFAIQKGQASFNGARTLSVSTDAAGRATATGLTATGRGALQIAASATFQGQTAAATIAQTTVMTTAEASTAAGTGSATAGGGRLSHVAVAALVGGAGAGIAGALVASKKSSSDITSRTLTGSFSTQLVMTTTTGGTACASTRSINGTMTIQLDERGDGSVTGVGFTTGTETETAVTQSPFCSASFGSASFAYRGPLTGTAGNFMFGQQTTSTSTLPASVTVINIVAFSGTLSNGVIAGTVNYSEASSGTGTGGSVISGSGSTTFPVTLR